MISLKILLIIGLAIACVGFMVGASSVVAEKRNTPTQRPERTSPSPDLRRPSRGKIVLPMALLLGLSVLMLVFGYRMKNFVLLAVGFLLLFLSFGLLGSFFFNEIY